MEKGPDLVLISLARTLSSKWPHANALIKMHLLQKRISFTYYSLHHNMRFHNLHFQPFSSPSFSFFITSDALLSASWQWNHFLMWKHPLWASGIEAPKTKLPKKKMNWKCTITARACMQICTNMPENQPSVKGKLIPNLTLRRHCSLQLR